MASNRCLEIKDAVDAARARLSLIRQGILPGDGAEWMPRFHGPKGRVHGPSHHSVQRNDGSVRFHIPATRSHRLTSATGATSFHFSHRSISKVTFATCQEGVRVKPGAARAHGRYVERQDAVALLDPAFVSEKTSKALDGASHNYVTTPRQEYREHDYTHDHDHIHIVSNPIDLNGKWIDDYQSFRRFEKIIRQIEKDEKLTEIKSSWEVKKRAPSHGQTQRFKKELREVAAGVRQVAILPVIERLQMAIDTAAKESSSVIELAKKLAEQGIETRLKITRTGLVQGISYGLDGIKFQGNQLYDCSLPKLQSVRGLNFDPKNDPQKLNNISNPNPNPQTIKSEPETVQTEKLSVQHSEKTHRKQRRLDLGGIG